MKKEKTEQYSSGKEDGVSQGIVNGKTIGRKIGRIETQLEQLDMDITRNTRGKRNRNIGLLIAAVIVCIIAVFLLFKVTAFIVSDIDISLVITVLGYICSSGLVAFLMNALFPVDISKIREIESLKVEEKRKELQQQLKNYEDAKG